jgi:4-hydroxy-2-oxoheptanedioate aldolase
MRKHLILGAALAGLAVAPALAGTGMPVAGMNTAAAQEAPSAQRINRAIELLEQGQPVYYTTVRGGAGYDEGREMAATQADYITYEMEHGALDFTALRNFMRGLVDAGPTRTGHRTPAVIATLPVVGDNPDSMRANFWVAQQAMAAGVHGILLVMAENPEAIEIFVEAMRYPFAEGANPQEAHRGSGSHIFASEIWGVEPLEYLRLADTWPLNPDGEVMLGLKIENPRGTENAEALAAVPGIAFVEWGPGDQSFYLLGRPVSERVARDERGRTYYRDGSNEHEPSMVATRSRVLQAAQAAGVYFLNACPEDDVINQIEEGTMICTGGETRAAEIGRAHTNRQGPW